MSPFWRIFLGTFCYVAAVVGLVLTVLNASQQPPATSSAIAFGAGGVAFGACGAFLTRRSRY